MPFFGSNIESRNEVFQRLKPACVALSQTTLALNGPRGSIPELVTRLETLHQATVSSTAAGKLLDEKLADYVFFPLSQVLKLSQRVSIRCLEIAVAILAVLVEAGWKHQIQPQLAAQILILCTLLASEKPTGLASSQTTVELRVSSLRCLESLFTALQGSPHSKALLQGEHNVPQVGQTLTTILEALEQSDDFGVQLEAVKALHAMIACVDDVDMVASFLPGLVSKLSRVLIPKTKLRRHHEILIGCLDIMGTLLVSVLGNPETNGDHQREDEKVLSKPPTINAKYLDAAAQQTKAALTGIFRLKDHDRSDVRLSLSQLCLRLLTKCNLILANSMVLAMETTLATSTSTTDSKSQLQSAMHAYPHLVSLLSDVLHSLLQSLTRTMQSADEQAKMQKLEQIRTAHELAAQCGANTPLLEREIANALRDSVVVTIQSPAAESPNVHSVQPVQVLDLKLLGDKSYGTAFPTALVQHRGQEEVLRRVESVVTYISQSARSSTLTTDAARSLQGSQGDAQAAQFWLLYVATNAALNRKDDPDSLIDFDQDGGTAPVSRLEELYSLSLTLLNDSSDQPTDNRMKSLALRGLALQAQVAGEDFRYELIDALYPVLHTLATPDQTLQRDSITALNVVTRACGYASTQDLIVSNVDYLTNAVALKLNAFDVSPQAPQVLLMMVRLAGPSLLPYLEDTVESIFAALEDFHGYPLLVELLFNVLNVLAEEGVKAPQLAIAAPTSLSTAQLFAEDSGPLQMTDLVAAVEERAHEDKAFNETSTTNSSGKSSFPRQPWTQKSPSGKDDNPAMEEDDAMARHDQQAAAEEVPPPAPKTYALLLKITDLTQHFLPSASPSLRTSLLGLIRTTVPALAQHENSFLPLINTLWPEVTARLDDEEAHVRATALEIIAIFCEYGKDFMRGRLIDLWPVLVEAYRAVAKDITSSIGAGTAKTASKRNESKTSNALVASRPDLKKALAIMHGAPADYSDTSTKLVWNALVEVITRAVECVSLPPKQFDEALEMAEPALQPKVAAAFEKDNADALWLVQMRSGHADVRERPSAMAEKDWQWAAIPG